MNTLNNIQTDEQDYSFLLLGPLQHQVERSHNLERSSIKIKMQETFP